MQLRFFQETTIKPTDAIAIPGKGRSTENLPLIDPIISRLPPSPTRECLLSEQAEYRAILMAAHDANPMFVEETVPLKKVIDTVNYPTPANDIAHHTPEDNSPEAIKYRKFIAEMEEANRQVADMAKLITHRPNILRAYYGFAEPENYLTINDVLALQATGEKEREREKATTTSSLSRYGFTAESSHFKFLAEMDRLNSEVARATVSKGYLK